jgi:hypothetical protein
MTRTTLVLENAAMRGVREVARREGRTQSDVVNEFLRDGLLRRRRPPAAAMRLPAHAMGRPRVNVADRDALERAMETP